MIQSFANWSGDRPGFRDAVDPEAARTYRDQGWWGDITLVDHLRRHRATRPGAPSYIADDGSLSWAQLDAVSDRIADVVIDLGVDPGTRVGVFIPDTATVHAVYLGLEKAGVVTVGIGARANGREVAHLLGSTGATVLLTLSEHGNEPAAKLRTSVEALGATVTTHIEVPVFEADPDAAILVNGVASSAAPATDIDERRIRPDDLSFINSTSGTTGLPKCVLHFQNRWLYFHQVAARHGEFRDDEVVMSLVPAPFGFGLWTAHYTPIVLGAPTVISRRFSARHTLELIEEHKVTVLGCVSTQFLMMLNEDTFDERDLSSLNAMFTGGEAVPEQRAAEFEKRSGCTVLQFYGSNETGVLSGTRPGEALERRLRTAGRVVPEMHVRLFDTEGVTPLGTTGEGRPACRGPATCLGYLDAEANATLFTDDGWMLMGDLCSIDEEGYLTVTGRTSDFIIRGGKNISASQVEDEVNTHPDVGLSAAVAIPDETFGERVCVYVELRAGATLTLDNLLTHLDERQTPIEVRPEALVVLDELPRSSGGKIAKGEIADDVKKRYG